MTYYDEEYNGTIEQDMTIEEAEELGMPIRTAKDLEEENIED